MPRLKDLRIDFGMGRRKEQFGTKILEIRQLAIPRDSRFCVKFQNLIFFEGYLRHQADIGLIHLKNDINIPANRRYKGTKIIPLI